MLCSDTRSLGFNRGVNYRTCSSVTTQGLLYIDRFPGPCEGHRCYTYCRDLPVSSVGQTAVPEDRVSCLLTGYQRNNFCSCVFSNECLFSLCIVCVQIGRRARQEVIVNSKNKSQVATDKSLAWADNLCTCRKKATTQREKRSRGLMGKFLG